MEDHRASKTGEPRTTYGKIVADSDSRVDLQEILFMTCLSLSKQYPNEDISTFEKHFEKAYEWIIEKNSESGYLKFYVDQKKIKDLDDLRNIIKNKNFIKAEYLKIYNKHHE